MLLHSRPVARHRCSRSPLTVRRASDPADSAGDDPQHAHAGTAALSNNVCSVRSAWSARPTATAATPAGGFDCSGLVGYVFRDVAGIELPRGSQDMSRIQAPDVTRDRLESGDIVFFHASARVSHVGIYVGKGRFVHAPNEGGTVRLDELDAAYWREHYASAKRIVH